MKAFHWILTAILAALVAWGYLHHREAQVPGPTPTTAAIRDSARASADSQRVRIDTVVRWVRSARADTMAAILRDRARRPAVLGRDTVWIPAPDTTGDSGCLSREELAGLEVHHAVDSATADSLRWEAKIQAVRGDSLAAHLGACLQEKRPSVSFPISFGLGYAAGIATCVVLQ